MEAGAGSRVQAAAAGLWCRCGRAGMSHTAPGQAEAEPQPGEGAAARGLSSDSNSHCVELDCAPRGAWEQAVFRVFSVANIKNKSRVVISASEQQL